jgi:hypothetical protein
MKLGVKLGVMRGVELGVQMTVCRVCAAVATNACLSVPFMSSCACCKSQDYVYARLGYQHTHSADVSSKALRTQHSPDKQTAYPQQPNMLHKQDCKLQLTPPLLLLHPTGWYTAAFCGCYSAQVAPRVLQAKRRVLQREGQHPGCDCDWGGYTYDNMPHPKSYSRLFTDECDKGPSLNRVSAGVLLVLLMCALCWCVLHLLLCKLDTT